MKNKNKLNFFTPSKNTNLDALLINAGLEDGDLIVIDRSIEPSNNKIAVCFIEGEFTVKRLIVKRNKIWLKPENATYKPIEVKDDDQLIIWGIVTNVIKKL